MTPKVIASTACLPGTQALGLRIADMRRHAITAIELGAGVSVDGGLDVLFGDHGVRYFVHNYFPPPEDSFVLNLASGDAAVRERSVAMVRNALELSARLGAPFYSVHGGFVTDPIGFDGTGFMFPAPRSQAETDAAIERYIRSVAELLPHAHRLGVALLIENNVCVPASVGKLLLQSAPEFERLFDAVPGPGLGMLLDTGHLNVTARTFGFDRLRFVDAVQEFVGAFHIHDNDGSADLHRPVTRDGWVLDVLRRGRFSAVPIVVEAKFSGAAELAEHVGWLTTALAA